MHRAATAETRTEFESSTGILIGKLGIWWFLASEIMVFGGLVGTYLLFRLASRGAWAELASHVNTTMGAINTVVLLTSSLTMVMAFDAIGSGLHSKTRLYLGLTVLLGLAFLGIKGMEYRSEIREGFTPVSGVFWSFYYTMTGLHGLHVLGGIVANAALYVMAVRGTLWPNVQQRVEYVGLYWHFVDVVWIFLFPLLYLSY